MTTLDTSLSAAIDHAQRHWSLRELLAAASAGAVRVTDSLLDSLDRARQRRQLLGLSDAALKDFRRSTADAEREGSKPFWHS